MLSYLTVTVLPIAWDWQALKKSFRSIKITFLIAIWLLIVYSHSFPLFSQFPKETGNALKPLINQGFLDFVKGLFPLFPLFLKLLHERKYIHFITLNWLIYVCLYIRVIFFGGKIEKSGNIYYILVITSANHRHLYRHLVLRCLFDFCECKRCWRSNLLFWPF